MLGPTQLKTDDGHVSRDTDGYAFLDADCPATANPGLWRQSRLCAPVTVRGRNGCVRSARP